MRVLPIPMDLTTVRIYLEEFEAKSNFAKIQLAEARKMEERRKVILSLMLESDALVEYLTTLTIDLRVLKEIVKREEAAFKRRRLSYLDGSITEKLSYIFPKKNLCARTECNFERNNTKLRLSLVDEKGNVRPPYLTEGKFAQQLISFAAAQSCTKLLGRNKLYLDEAFSNASEDNLIKMQELLKTCVEDGFQIILISQSPLLFSDIKRHEIILKSQDGQFIDSVVYQDYN